MLQHVVERVQEAAVFDDVRVATDDVRIAGAVLGSNVTVVRSQRTHATGTDRIAAAANDLAADAIVFNVQGDEPLIAPDLLADLMQMMVADPTAQMATAAHVESDAQAFHNPNVVKVTRDALGRALYFSRAAIPHTTDAGSAFLRHVGVYAFRQSTLQRFVSLPVGKLEATEGLEQLRALENGIPIHVHLSDYRSVGVDTPDDLQRVELQLAAAAVARAAKETRVER
jgi:3-deoxy-manno-octulosonate cytidylyltransferase (CMP-KDO synthetase)